MDIIKRNADKVKENKKASVNIHKYIKNYNVKGNHTYIKNIETHENKNKK